MPEGWGGGNISDAISRYRFLHSGTFRRALAAADKQMAIAIEQVKRQAREDAAKAAGLALTPRREGMADSSAGKRDVQRYARRAVKEAIQSVDGDIQSLSGPSM